MAGKFNRYVLIIQKLRRAGERGFNFNEIQKYVFGSSGTMDPEDQISLRTFQRYIHDIKDSFGIQIACNGFGCYHIENENSDQKLNLRLLEAIHLYSLGTWWAWTAIRKSRYSDWTALKLSVSHRSDSLFLQNSAYPNISRTVLALPGPIRAGSPVSLRRKVQECPEDQNP
jgi:hypothetical protein